MFVRLTRPAALDGDVSAPKVAGGPQAGQQAGGDLPALGLLLGQPGGQRVARHLVQGDVFAVDAAAASSPATGGVVVSSRW